MNLDEATVKFGEDTRLLLHRIESVMERVPEAREMLGDVDFHEARRRLDLLMAQMWAAGIDHATSQGEARTALITVAAEWHDVIRSARTSAERVTAEAIYTAFVEAARRFTAETNEPRYRFDPESPAARSFFDGETSEHTSVAAATPTTSTHDGV